MLSKNLEYVDLTNVPRDQWKSYFGKGYRSVFYEVDSETHCGIIWFFGYDTLDNPTIFKIPWECHIWYRVMFETDMKDMHGHFLKEKKFKTVSQRWKYVKDSPGLNVVECLKPESEFLHWAFDNVVLDADFNHQVPRTFFLDIEIEITDHFVGANEASVRINMVTVFDTKTQLFYTWSLQSVKKRLDESRYVLFDEFNDNEAKMLIHFVHWWEKNYPDAIATWNGQSFDDPFIVKRLEIVLGEDYAKKLSPVGRYRFKEVNHDDARANQEAEVEVEISGVFEADLLRLYRDKFKIADALDGGYNLSNVGEHEGLGRKVEYEGTLKDLYEKDWQKFYEYNVRDVDLLKKIEDKCKLIPLAIKVVGTGLVGYNAIYASNPYIVGSLIAYAKSEFGVVFNSYVKEKRESQSFEGAYVFPARPGMYKNGIAGIDVNSLYPSAIRILNLSPETYVGKIGLDGVSNIDDPIDLSKDVRDFYAFRRAGSAKIEQISRESLLKILKEKCIFTRNNTLFLKHSVKQGIVSGWAKHFYNYRKSTKKEMQRLEMALYNKEIPEDKIAETQLKVENLNALQQSTKIKINSLYGLLGLSVSPIGNPELAQTVTRQGKHWNISASKYIRDSFVKMFRISDDYITTLNGDTDSQFVNIQCITQSMKEKYGLSDKIFEWSDEMKLKLWNFVEKFVSEKVNAFVKRLIVDECHSEHPEVFNYSLEYIADNGIYEVKKHYICRKIVSEGPELVNKVKVTGIELKKATIPVAIKDILRDIYYSTLIKDWTSDDFNKYLLDAYERFLKLSVNDIGTWKGWSSDKIPSKGFLKVGLGTTGISKACHYYNDLIKHLGLGKKYDELRTGGKYKFVYLNKNNQYGIDCIAFVDEQWPKEFDKIFSVDYQLMFEKSVKDPLRSFLEATGFVFKDPREREVFSLDEL